MSVVSSTAVLLLAGCASEGPLRPPSLHLPGPVRGLSAERAGNTVVLRWTTPTRTTDGVPLAGKHGAGRLTAEICREEMPFKSSCSSIAQISVTSGTGATFSNTLQPSLIMGDLRPLHYRVRILNRQGRGAEYASADTLAGAAPPPVRNLRAFPVTGGTALRWQQDPAAANLRTLIRVTWGSEEADVPMGAGATHSDKTDLLAIDALPRDPGGAIDSGAKRGIVQTYTVVHTRAINFNGKELTVSSAPATVALAANAKSPPPSPPSSLEALANTLSAPEIDLVWQPSSGAAAYKVYRAEGTGESTILTPTPVQALTYTDTAVRPGVRYRYSISAVDGDGTQGPRSSEILSTVPQP